MRRILLMSNNPETAWIQTLFEQFDCAAFQTAAQPLSLDEAEQIRPDLILWDSTGIHFSSYKFASLLRSRPSLRSVPLIIISSQCSYTDRISALKSGADLQICDTFMPEELLAVSGALMDQAERLRQRTAHTVCVLQQGFLVMLTIKESQILRQVANGSHNREIADALSISRRTVESHITSMLSKTGLTNRTQLARWAMEHCNVPSALKSSVVPFQSTNERMRQQPSEESSVA